MPTALFLYGGMDFHEPKPTSERFAALLTDRGYDVTLTDDVAILDDAHALAAMDLIVICITMGEISDDQERALLGTVRAGTGLAGWHGGLADAFRSRTEYQFAVGGQWVAHPGDILDYTVEIADDEHEITAGLGSFGVRSEQYYLHTDPGNHVLATTTFSGEHAPWIDGVEMPVAWTKMYGEGRVFYCSIGHVDANFDASPTAATLIERGLVWATRRS